MTDWLRQLEHDHELNTADMSVSPVSSLPSHLAVFSIQHVAANTETLVYKTTRKIEIVDVHVTKDVADAGGTVQVKDGAHNAITDAMAAAVDKVITRAASCDKLYRTIAAGGTFEVTFTKGAGTSASEVLIFALLRA